MAGDLTTPAPTILPTPGAGEAIVITTLSELIERLGAGVARFDERFARDLSRALHAKSRHLKIPAIERLALEDVVATLYMDRRLRLVVTGNLAEVRGAVSVTWDESDFPLLPIALHREPLPEPYTFATLDFSLRGRGAVLTAAVAPLPAGQTVKIRALATIGERTEYRVSALGLERSVSPDGLRLLGEEGGA